MHPSFPTAIVLTGAAVFALAACTAGEGESDRIMAATSVPATAHVSHVTPAAGPVMRGDSFAMMSEQYTRRAGPYAGTGASAWVAPSPAPAFVASGPLPPADAPAPPPAAVANRQPAASVAPASEIARPEAAQPEADTAPERDPAVRTAGLALFNASSCNACHAFADAGAAGAIGPSLDRDLAVRTIVNTLHEGRGAMPSFEGQLSDEEMLTLANYIPQYSR